jgi:hypothetical protein
MADPAPPRQNDWPAQAADRVESVVGTIRDRTVRPLTVVVRGVVYGLIAGVLGIAVIVLLSIAAVRVVDVYLPEDVWAADLAVGMFFTLLGLVLWRKRRSTKKD